MYKSRIQFVRNFCALLFILTKNPNMLIEYVLFWFIMKTTFYLQVSLVYTSNKSPTISSVVIQVFGSQIDWSGWINRNNFLHTACNARNWKPNAFSSSFSWKNPYGGTWPMFGYRGAAERLKSWPCLGQEYAKNPTLRRTTASISLPCLGQVTKCTLAGFTWI